MGDGRDVKAGLFSAGASLFKVNWGIGMMAMPYYLYKAGIVAGLIFFVLTMGLTYLSITRLLRVADEISRRGTKKQLSFSGIVGEVLGPRGEAISAFCICLSCFGSCIAYLKFIGDNMSKFVGGSAWAWVLGSSVPVTALAWLDDLKWLDGSNALGLACAAIFVVIIFINASMDLSWEEFEAFLDEKPGINDSPTSLFVATGLAVFCNEGIVVLSPSVRNGMKCPEKISMVLALVMAVFTTFYMAIALTGYALYGDDASDLALALPRDSARSRIAVILYSCQLVPTFAIVYFMAVEASEDIYLRLHQGYAAGRDLSSEAYKDHRRAFVGVRSGGVFLCATIALAVPSFGDFLALSGASANSMTIYILPFVCYLRLFHFKEEGHTPGTHKESLGMSLIESDTTYGVDHSWLPSPLSSCDVVASLLVVLFGIATMIVGTYSSALGLFST